jgi:N-acetylglutamate synthase-like GNAT family acetyltransferase
MRKIEENDRAAVHKYIRTYWGSEMMVSRGKVHYPADQQGYIIEKGKDIICLITYVKEGDEIEITLIDSRERNKGHASKLLDKVKDVALADKCSRIWLIATNDNLRAIGFYQKNDFDLVRLHHNAINESRKLKPGLPLTGFAGIPIRHELEFEFRPGN